MRHCLIIAHARGRGSNSCKAMRYHLRVNTVHGRKSSLPPGVWWWSVSRLLSSVTSSFFLSPLVCLCSFPSQACPLVFWVQVERFFVVFSPP